jgi:hypothetical protein
MKRISLTLLSAVIGFGAATALPALADEVTGRVVHVSANNIKVHELNGATRSFLVTPNFGNVFDSNGKTITMRRIHPGEFVHVYYDAHFLGVAHATKIRLG